MNKNIFWNSQEQRLRAFWRLLILIVAYYSLFLVASIIVGIILSLVGVPQSAFHADTPLYYQLTFPCSQIAGGIAMLVTLWLVARWINREPFVRFGFQGDPGWWLDLLFGLLVSFVLSGGIFLVELANGWITIRETFHVGIMGVPFLFALLPLFIQFVGVAISEETLIRGYPVRNFAQGLSGLGTKRALLVVWLISCILFGLGHFSNPHVTLLGMFNIGLAGILFGLSYVLTGRLGLAIGLHIAWDFCLSCVFGIPIAGLTPGVAASVFVINDHGPALWTGGAFGGNGGLLGTFAFLLGTIPVLLYLRLRYHRLTLYTPLAEYAPITSTRSVEVATVGVAEKKSAPY